MLTRRGLQFGMAALAASAGAPGASAQPRHFRDKDLHGQDFTRRDMSNNDFSRANLEEADLSFANFSGCIMKGANLQKATLKLTRFVGADFTEADLRDAQMVGARFRDAKFTKANLSGVTLYLAQAAAVLEGHSDLSFGIKDALQSVGGSPDIDNGSLSFLGANLRNAQVFGNISRVNFRGADLRGTDLSKTENIHDAVLRGAIYNADTSWKINPAEFGAVKG